MRFLAPVSDLMLLVAVGLDPLEASELSDLILLVALGLGPFEASELMLAMSDLILLVALGLGPLEASELMLAVIVTMRCVWSFCKGKERNGILMKGMRL
jgi:hypothetical protein